MARKRAGYALGLTVRRILGAHLDRVLRERNRKDRNRQKPRRRKKDKNEAKSKARRKD